MVSEQKIHTIDKQWQQFLSLFVISFLFDLAEPTKPLFPVIAILLISFTGFFLKKKTKGLIHTGLAFFFLHYLVNYFPSVANHVNFQLILILFYFSVLFFNRRSEKPLDTLDILKCFQFGLIAVYFLAVFHKLNWDFINPLYGCTVWIFSKMGVWWGFDLAGSIPSIGLTLLPYIYLGSLTLGFILLSLSGAARIFGILILSFFHISVSFAGFADFSSFTLAFYILFLPTNIWEQFLNKKFFGRISFTQWALSCATLMVFFTAINQKIGLFKYYHYHGIFLVLAFAPLFNTLFQSLFKKNLRTLWSKDSSLFKNFQNIHLCIATVVLAFGMTPYIGLRSQGNFTMFSNLKVENGSNNHIFMPQLDWFPFLWEVVWLKQVDGIPNFTIYGIPEIEFRRQLHFDFKKRWLQEKKPLPVTLEYKGKEYSYKNIFTDSSWTQPPPWYVFFLDFRSIQYGKTQPNRCRY